MIEDKILYLYHTDFCAAATEALDGAVTVTAAGGLAGGVFSKKPSPVASLGKSLNQKCLKFIIKINIPLYGPLRNPPRLHVG